MASVSYSLLVGQTQEQLTPGTNAPSAGSGAIELRVDQTTNAVTDGAYAGSTRPVTKQEVLTALITFIEYLQKDTNIFPGQSS